MSGKQRTPRQLYRMGYAYGRKDRVWATHPLHGRKAFTKGYDAGQRALAVQVARRLFASL